MVVQSEARVSERMIAERDGLARYARGCEPSVRETVHMISNGTSRLLCIQQMATQVA